MVSQQPAQQPAPLTPEAYSVAITFQLGNPTAEYRPKFTTRKAISIALLVVLALACAVLGIISSKIGAFMIIVVGAVVLLVMTLGDMFLSRDKLVYVCPAGLLYQHNGKTDAIRWDQVEAFWQRVVRRYSYGIQTGTYHQYTIRRYDGATFKFDDHLYNVGALGDTIARETTRLLWPRFIAAYQAGQTINFGQISLNLQGVSNGKELLPWQQVKEIKVKGGFVSIQKDDNHWLKWRTIQASKIPNVNVFLAMVDYIGKGGRR
jgi:hypothetical protein